MGCAVEAKCGCGLDRQIYDGQGFEDHETVCSSPRGVIVKIGSEREAYRLH